MELKFEVGCFRRKKVREYIEEFCVDYKLDYYLLEISRRWRSSRFYLEVEGNPYAVGLLRQTLYEWHTS